MILRRLRAHYTAKAIREAGRQMTRDISSQRLAAHDAGILRVSPAERERLEDVVFGGHLDTNRLTCGDGDPPGKAS